jgi:hypothetical protein
VDGLDGEAFESNARLDFVCNLPDDTQNTRIKMIL